jgi:hypothetical protein
VQFYLGTFDSEEDAARAYDRKARDEKGGRSQTNFDESGAEILTVQSNYRYALDPDELETSSSSREDVLQDIRDISGSFSLNEIHSNQLMAGYGLPFNFSVDQEMNQQHQVRPP